jgi:hydroxymethylglutaryl-CoA lyase
MSEQPRATASSEVRLREVLPRDGFQDLDFFVPTELKIEIIHELHAMGCQWIEVTSFVHPGQVRQFTDAEYVARAVRHLPGLTISAFVPNMRGLYRALEAGVDEVSLAVASTDALAVSNFRRQRDEVIAETVAVADTARAEGKDVSVAIGGAWGCPFEGTVHTSVILDIARWLAESGIETLLLADTIGSGTPDRVGALVNHVTTLLPTLHHGVHIHGEDGLGSVRSALTAGATVVDTAMGGFGGCPFVPEAPGNVDTTAVAAMLDQRGAWTGPPPAELAKGAHRIRERLDAHRA